MRFESATTSSGRTGDGFVSAASDTRVLSASRPRTRGVSRKALSENFQQPYLREFFHKEPNPYNHTIFQHSSQVFDALKHVTVDTHSPTNPRRRKEEPIKAPPTEIPSIDFDSENEKRLTFQLVFQTLKYQRFLEDMLGDCMFFGHFPEFKEDISVVMVMLCDFKQRKFQKRQPGGIEFINPYFCQIEEALWQCRTKLNAALARSRIKARVLSIDHLLPDSVRQNDKIGSNMHVYGWVNNIKTSMESVLDQLREDGYIEVQSEGRLTGNTFLLDNQCMDMICFSYDNRDDIENHELVEDYKLILQDKSSCVGPHSVRALINEGDDILHVNMGSGISTAHIASLTHDSDSIVFAVGAHNEKQQRQITTNLELLGAKSSVKVLPENFMDISHTDERLKHIKVILLSAECSRSGVANPVNFIVSEGEEMSILRDLSVGYTDESKLGELVVRHNATLKHALRFPRVQAVVYCTRSLLEAENENVVTRSIEYVNMVQQKKTPYRIAPPVIPLSDRDIEMENPLNGKYLRYPPSAFMSGCFIATITREADDPKEAAKDILAKAAARGIISGVAVQKEEKPHKSKSKSGRRREKSDKQTKGHKKSPVRSPARRTKSMPQKDTPPPPMRATVSSKFYSTSTYDSPKLPREGSDACVMSPVTPQVFQTPFTYSYLSQDASPPSSPSKNALRPRPKTPPHAKVLRHPTPFR